MSHYRGGSSRSSSQSGSKLYVGNLPGDVNEKDIEDIFSKYGKILDVDLKNSRGRGVGPPFAFVEFDDYRDAQDAMRGRDGYPLNGYKLKVEFPRGASGNFRGGFRGGRGGGGGFGGGGGGGGGGGRRSRRPECCVTVTGLPPTGSWQDLKDHMREAGDVLFTDVNKDGTGYVEFAHEEYARYAVKNLNDSKFRSHEGEIAYIHVRENYDHGMSHRGRSYSPRRSPHRSRPSPNYSPRKYSYSRSRSRSRSPY